MNYKSRKHAIISNRVKNNSNMIDKLHNKIDRRAKKGKTNENDAEHHYAGTTKDGNRVWSY